MAASQSLPPGTSGLPLLGETLAFASNPFAFVSERRARHGDVFRTSMLGKPTVRSATWTLPAQDLTMKWVVPPEHRRDLVVAWSRLVP